MKHKTISDKKQKLIDAKNKSPLEVGETISVLDKVVKSYSSNPEKSCTCTIHSLEDGINVFVGLERDRQKHTEFAKITKSDIVSRNISRVGANPLDESIDNIRSIAFSLDSVLFGLNVFGDKKNGAGYSIEGIEVLDSNFNPFIYNKKGKKEYYQRPFVWEIKDKQLLIQSIYQNIDCGKIIIRLRGFDELQLMQAKGETELSLRDVVDGKQRLKTVQSFMLDEFTDLEGNFYSDLSAVSQHLFTDHQLFSYAEMPENSKDEDVLMTFLKLNFTGVPQSEEHINFVKSLQNKI